MLEHKHEAGDQDRHLRTEEREVRGVTGVHQYGREGRHARSAKEAEYERIVHGVLRETDKADL
ncbi:hypothetical protein [Bradyrhizobium elkanii]|uniref:hypothetical protein n=1 Tax=Bradyrhizobium elkanii TaxID=29448 RepID=UPI003D204A02